MLFVSPVRGIAVLHIESKLRFVIVGPKLSLLVNNMKSSILVSFVGCGVQKATAFEQVELH